MAFHTFISYTTITASDMNDNFQFVGGSHWLPRGGASLDATNGVYNLGSQSFYWDNVYVNSLSVSGYSNTSCWNMISQVILSAAATSVEFTGLIRDLYKVIFDLRQTSSGSGANSGIYLYFNNDSASNYGYILVYATSTIAIYTATNLPYIGLSTINNPAGTTGVYISAGDILIYGNSEYEKVCLICGNDLCGGTNIGMSRFENAIWNNLNTLTSIKIISSQNLATNTTVQLWSPL